MATLLSCRELTKTNAARPLFSGLTFGIDDDERIGLIGPNGSGKSTLLKVLSGIEKPDSGTLSVRRGLKIGYVAQEENFGAGATVESVLLGAFTGEPLEENERAARVEKALALGGFEDRTRPCDKLSGGWRKRLAIVSALLAEPELLFLDEPTNHVDLAGVEWLEEVLERPSFAFVVVTHDRYFLENVTNRIIELHPAYAEGFLSVEGGYGEFIEQRAAYLAAQAHQQVALASEVRKEIAWLRRGAKARTTKAKGRIEDAGEKIADLAELTRRNTIPAAIEGNFTASGRRTKELLVTKSVSKSLGGRTLFKNVDMVLTPGLKLGIVGSNGSGKTTLMRLFSGDLAPDSGEIRRADGLRSLWFDQERTGVNRETTLRLALCPQGDSVRFGGSVLHVSAWAKKFLFREDQLGAKVGTLSGGEQARVALANLMLQEADLLLLDEPTNDLDLPSLGVLEEALEKFPGALALVSHDRFLLDKVCNQILALEPDGTVNLYADYAQWTAHRNTPAATPTSATAKPEPPKPVSTSRALTASERKELERIEETILTAEEKVAEVEAKMASPEIASDSIALQKMWNEDLPKAKAEVERLYARWEELENKKNGA
ncbi:MAG: ABC-F family ATP-binding cassette domain-containing protein [Armatimonas sp.]